MKGFRTRSEGGFARTGIGGNASATLARMPIAPLGDRKREEEFRPGSTGTLDPILQERGQAILDAIRGASNLR